VSEKQPVTKTHDYWFRSHGYWTDGTICRIRIYNTEPPTIIASELVENHNSSITNLVEYLYPEVVGKHFPAYLSDARPVRWLEHYPPMEAPGTRGKTQEYSQVVFSSYTPRVSYLNHRKRVVVGDPEWRHISEDEVTELLGQNPSRGETP
jgi:hypothetical protein